MTFYLITSRGIGSKACCSNNNVALCHRLWDFPRYLSKVLGMAMPGWHRDSASTNVLSADGWQSFCMTWLPLHIKGMISAAKDSRCLSDKMLQILGNSWSQSLSARLMSMWHNWAVAFRKARVLTWEINNYKKLFMKIHLPIKNVFLICYLVLKSIVFT